MYLSEKVFLSFGKRFGWILGFLGSIAYTIITLNKGVYAYSGLEITSGIIFLFGFFAWQRHAGLQRNVTICMSIIAILGIFVIFMLNLESQHWILEDTMVVFFASGAVFLVLKRPVGWLLHIAGSLVIVFLTYFLQTYFIMGMQIISIPFYIIGYRNLRRSKST